MRKMIVTNAAECKINLLVPATENNNQPFYSNVRNETKSTKL